jgi:hypothetical protein
VCFGSLELGRYRDNIDDYSLCENDIPKLPRVKQ